jgi:hypothetical protein
VTTEVVTSLTTEEKYRNRKENEKKGEVKEVKKGKKMKKMKITKKT